MSERELPDVGYSEEVRDGFDGRRVSLGATGLVVAMLLLCIILAAAL